MITIVFDQIIVKRRNMNTCNAAFKAVLDLTELVHRVRSDTTVSLDNDRRVIPNHERKMTKVERREQ